MKVLVACEFSGIVRDAFLARGHDAYSCDIIPTESNIPDRHFQCDIRDLDLSQWDLMIAHPPCTHLACSGARWFYKKEKEQKEALEFVRYLMDAPVNRIALENPVGIISSHIRKPDQIIQPWQFGDCFQKRTCLWLKNLPKLIPTKYVDHGEMKIFDSGRKMPKWIADAWSLPKNQRSKIKCYTFKGIANAMASQWSTPFLP